MLKIFMIIFLLFGSLSAATFNVSTTPELRTALESAASNSEDDTIILADGTYKTTDNGQGTFIYKSDDLDELILVGSSSENVVLSGDNQDQIFNHTSTIPSHLSLKNLSFVDGNITAGVKEIYNRGAGVYTDFTINLEGCIFNNNHIYNANLNGVSGGIAYGGGFYSHGAANVKNSKFISNSSWVGGGFASRNKVIVMNSTFSNNIGSSGAGFHTTSDYYIVHEVHDSEFNENIAIAGDGRGGGFRTYGSVNITNSIFDRNEAARHSGAFACDTATIKHSIFRKNKATSSGVVHSENLFVENSLFYGNSTTAESGTAGAGGALTSLEALTVINSIFVDNRARNQQGGGINLIGSANISNSLFIGGSGIYAYTNPYLAVKDNKKIINSIFINNYGNDISGDDRVTVVLRNNYLDLSNVTVVNYSEKNIFVGINLGFADEENDNYRLTASSDLIDSGTTTVDGIAFPETDLDGNARVVGGNIDIGPYEYQVLPSIPTNVTASDGTLELAVAVSWSEVDNTNYYNVSRSESQDVIGDIVGITESTSFVDDTVEENTKYYYRISACNDNGCSDYSIEDSGYIGNIVQPINPAIIIYLLN